MVQGTSNSHTLRNHVIWGHSSLVSYLLSGTCLTLLISINSILSGMNAARAASVTHVPALLMTPSFSTSGLAEDVPWKLPPALRPEGHLPLWLQGGYKRKPRVGPFQAGLPGLPAARSRPYKVGPTTVSHFVHRGLQQNGGFSPVTLCDPTTVRRAWPESPLVGDETALVGLMGPGHSTGEESGC